MTNPYEDLNALLEKLVARCAAANLSDAEATEFIWQAFGAGVAQERSRTLEALRVQVSLLEAAG